MYYAIERQDAEYGRMLDATESIAIGRRVYDIFVCDMDTRLERISDFVIDENLVVLKADVTAELAFLEEFGNTYGQVQRLLFS
jgi:hypothetical protein